MKRPKRESREKISKQRTSDNVTKRHKPRNNSCSDSKCCKRRCMSTELLQLLCLQRSHSELANCLLKRKTSNKSSDLPPAECQAYVKISTWSLASKDCNNFSEDDQKDNPFFLDFVNLYTKVREFHSGKIMDKSGLGAYKSSSLPSITELPTFAHIVSKLKSFFKSDTERFKESIREHEGNAINMKPFYSDKPVDWRYSPIVPKLNREIPKKSSLTEFLSRIGYISPDLGETQCTKNGRDLSSRLQSNTSNEHVKENPKDNLTKLTINKKLKKKTDKERSSSARKCKGEQSRKGDPKLEIDSRLSTPAKQEEDQKKEEACDENVGVRRDDEKNLFETFEVLLKKLKASQDYPHSRRRDASKRKKSKHNKNHDVDSAEKRRSPAREVNKKSSIEQVPKVSHCPDHDAQHQHAPSPEVPHSNDLKNPPPVTTFSYPKTISDCKEIIEQKTNVERSQGILNETKEQNTSNDQVTNFDSANVEAAFPEGLRSPRGLSPTSTFSHEEEEELNDLSNCFSTNCFRFLGPTSTGRKRGLDQPASLLKDRPYSVSSDLFFKDLFSKFSDKHYFAESTRNDCFGGVFPHSNRVQMQYGNSRSKSSSLSHSVSLTDLLKERFPDVMWDRNLCMEFAPTSYFKSNPTDFYFSERRANDAMVPLDDMHSLEAFGSSNSLQRKDSVMGDKPLTSLMLLREKQTCSSALQDSCRDKLYSFQNSIASKPCRLERNGHGIESRFLVHSKSRIYYSPAQGREEDVVHFRDETPVQFDHVKPSFTSVCIQTVETQDEYAESANDLTVKNSIFSTDSSMSVIRRFTKLHKLVSVPLNSAPLTAHPPRHGHNKSPTIRPKSGSGMIMPLKIIRKLSPTPDLEFLRVESLRPEHQPPVKHGEDVGYSSLPKLILIGGKSSSIQSKKYPNKNCNMHVSYFKSRNKNISFRNGKVSTQTFVGRSTPEENTNYSRRAKIIHDGLSSSSNEDFADEMSPLQEFKLAEETILSANDKFSRLMNQGKCDEALKLTFDRGFSVDWEDPWSGERALVLAVVKSRHEIMERLLDLGSILDAPDVNGRTAFLASAIHVDHKAAWLLLSHGLEVVCVVPLKVAYGRSKNVAQFARFLGLTITSGFRPYKEVKWFENILRSNSIDHEKDRQLIQTTLNLLSSCTQPSSLSVLCFVSIRRHLSKVNKGRSIARSVNLLPLPKALRGFLIMEGALS